MNKVVQAAALALLLAHSVSLAQDYDQGLHAAAAGDFEAALEEWRPLAERGDADAQYNLGVMYGDPE